MSMFNRKQKSWLAFFNIPDSFIAFPNLNSVNGENNCDFSFLLDQGRSGNGS